MVDVGGLYERQIEAASLALGRGDRPAAVEALSAAIDTTRGDPALHRQHVDALIRLASLKQELTQPGQAERLLAQALAVGERHLGANSAELVVPLNELSRLYVRQSAFARAEPLLERLLAIKSGKGEDHPDVATALAALAVVRRGLGDDSAAEGLYRRALAIREKVLAPGHMAVVITLEQLSETCAARGNFSEALALLARALPTREQALGVEHATVRGLRTRISALELHVAGEARTAAVIPAPPSPPAPVTEEAPAANQLVFIYQPEKPPRRASQTRERHATPQFSAAVAAASFIAAPAAMPLAAQVAAPTQITAPALTGVPVAVAIASQIAATTLDDMEVRPRRSMEWSPAPAKSVSLLSRKQAARYAPAAAVVVSIGIVALAASSYAADRRDREEAPPVVTTSPVAGATPVTTTRGETSLGAPAAAAVVNHDSSRAASVTPTRVTSDIPTRVASLQKAPQATTHEGAPATLPSAAVALPTVAAFAMPTSAMPNVDSVMRNSAKAGADSYGYQVGAAGRLRTTAYSDDRPATPPVMIGAAPQPRFPDALRAQRLEGEVVVQFLVNDKGFVEPSSMQVVRSPHELFTAAVRSVLPRFRFEPARSAGPSSKPIAEMVQYAIQFNAAK